MSISTAQEILPYSLGGAAVTNFIWLEWLQPGYQIALAVLGLVVLVLTIKHKLLEIRIKQDILRKNE